MGGAVNKHNNTVNSDAQLLFMFFATGTLIFLWLAGFEAYRWWLMNHDKATAQATVTSARFHPCTGRGCSGVNHPHQVRYQFSPPGSGRNYTYTGQWLLSEMWARVPESAYLAAQASHTIDVVYAISNPRINQPSINPTKSAYEWIGFGVLAILSFGVGWYIATISNHAVKGDAAKARRPFS